MVASLESYTFQRLSADDQVKLLGSFQQLSTFDESLSRGGLKPLGATGVDTLQVNVGKKCNQQCEHCHVDAGPHRNEEMSRETFEHCLRVIELADIKTVDITGGAPELNPHFRWFVEQVRELGAHVMDRCNLTITQTPKFRDLPQFFADNDVEVVASLPHFRAKNTDRQRGDGVFAKSIAAMRELNQLGYGSGNPKRRLSLVTNPVGAYLPAGQTSMEDDWKRQLSERHGITFDNLYSITNMPIARFLEWLVQTDRLEEYLQTLVESFNPSAVPGVMCRTMLSVSWEGNLYDCDFNQMLELSLVGDVPQSIANIEARHLDALHSRRIHTERHCFGCTAGAGSSCGGNTTAG